MSERPEANEVGEASPVPKEGRHVDIGVGTFRVEEASGDEHTLQQLRSIASLGDKKPDFQQELIQSKSIAFKLSNNERYSSNRLDSKISDRSENHMVIQPKEILADQSPYLSCGNHAISSINQSTANNGTAIAPNFNPVSANVGELEDASEIQKSSMGGLSTIRQKEQAIIKNYTMALPNSNSIQYLFQHNTDYDPQLITQESNEEFKAMEQPQQPEIRRPDDLEQSQLHENQVEEPIENSEIQHQNTEVLAHSFNMIETPLEYDNDGDQSGSEQRKSVPRNTAVVVSVPSQTHDKQQMDFKFKDWVQPTSPPRGPE